MGAGTRDAATSAAGAMRAEDMLVTDMQVVRRLAFMEAVVGAFTVEAGSTVEADSTAAVGIGKSKV
jgi:hypothetical protein